MAYFRRPKDHEHPYAQISNAMLEDDTLSFKAKGLLSYLLSRCDDWDVYQSQLADLGPDGETSVRSGIDELMEAGYIQREPRRNEDGTIAEWEYVVRESPLDDDEARSGFSRSGSSKTGKAGTTNTDTHQNGKEARAREGDTEGVQIWVDVTGERPTIGTRQELKKYFTTEAPRWDPEAFRSVLREAYVNVDRDARRIQLGYLESAYEKELEHDTNMAVTEDGKLKGSPEPGAEYNPRGYRIN